MLANQHSVGSVVWGPLFWEALRIKSPYYGPECWFSHSQKSLPAQVSSCRGGGDVGGSFGARGTKPPTSVLKRVAGVQLWAGSRGLKGLAAVFSGRPLMDPSTLPKQGKVQNEAPKCITHKFVACMYYILCTPAPWGQGQGLILKTPETAALVAAAIPPSPPPPMISRGNCHLLILLGKSDFEKHLDNIKLYENVGPFR